MALCFHGTPITPNAAFEAIMPQRAACVSYFRTDQVALAESLCANIFYDNGAFSFWQQALRRGAEWDETQRGWIAYYAWLDERLWHPGRWAVIPDQPGAPSQLNDSLLNDWPHGTAKGAPLWHMNAPVERLGRLCERYSRVCLGWVGDGPDERAVGCDAYRRRMDEVSAFLGNRWPVLHMMRGVAVAGDYPFDSADSTSLAQNGHRHDWRDNTICMFNGPRQKWFGRREYADKLEALAA